MTFNYYLKAFNLISFDSYYYRVRTFKTFSRHFCKTVPDLMLPNRWSIETLKNLFFFKIHCKCQ